MNADDLTTFGANPVHFFIADKTSDPDFIYHFEIFDHAHFILYSVTLIQLFQPGARETITTIETIFGFAFGDLFAVSDFTCRRVF